MPDIKFNCPSCGQSLEAPDDIRGQQINCPACNQIVEIPNASPPSALHSKRPNLTPPTKNTIIQKQLHQLPTQSPSGKQSSRRTITFIILTIVCLGLGCGLFYLIQKNHKVTLDGEIFIVTQGGPSIKLALVEVGLIPMRTLQPYLERRHAESTNLVADLLLQLKPAQAEIERLSAAADSALKKYTAATEGERQRNTLGYYDDPSAMLPELLKLRDLMGPAQEVGDAIVEKITAATSAAFYFDKMPRPVRTTKTNADGKFSIQTPTAEPYAIMAFSSRQAPEQVEYYYWLIKLDPKSGKKQTIMLSNDNLASSIPETFLKSNQ